MLFFGKKQKKEIDKTMEMLNKQHIRQVTEIEETIEVVQNVNQALISGVKTRNITESIAAATGVIK